MLKKLKEKLIKLGKNLSNINNINGILIGINRLQYMISKELNKLVYIINVLDQEVFYKKKVLKMKLYILNKLIENNEKIIKILENFLFFKNKKIVLKLKDGNKRLIDYIKLILNLEIYIEVKIFVIIGIFLLYYSQNLIYLYFRGLIILLIILIYSYILKKTGNDNYRTKIIEYVKDKETLQKIYYYYTEVLNIFEIGLGIKNIIEEIMKRIRYIMIVKLGLKKIMNYIDNIIYFIIYIVIDSIFESYFIFRFELKNRLKELKYIEIILGRINMILISILIYVMIIYGYQDYINKENIIDLSNISIGGYIRGGLIIISIIILIKSILLILQNMYITYVYDIGILRKFHGSYGAYPQDSYGFEELNLDQLSVSSRILKVHFYMSEIYRKLFHNKKIFNGSRGIITYYNNYKMFKKDIYKSINIKTILGLFYYLNFLVTNIVKGEKYLNDSKKEMPNEDILKSLSKHKRFKGELIESYKTEESQKMIKDILEYFEKMLNEYKEIFKILKDNNVDIELYIYNIYINYGEGSHVYQIFFDILNLEEIDGLKINDILSEKFEKIQEVYNEGINYKKIINKIKNKDKDEKIKFSLNLSTITELGEVVYDYNELLRELKYIYYNSVYDEFFNYIKISNFKVFENGNDNDLGNFIFNIKNLPEKRAQYIEDVKDENGELSLDYKIIIKELDDLFETYKKYENSLSDGYYGKNEKDEFNISNEKGLEKQKERLSVLNKKVKKRVEKRIEVIKRITNYKKIKIITEYREIDEIHYKRINRYNKSYFF